MPSFPQGEPHRLRRAPSSTILLRSYRQADL
jgi:hypothetical protein